MGMVPQIIINRQMGGWMDRQMDGYFNSLLIDRLINKWKEEQIDRLLVNLKKIKDGLENIHLNNQLSNYIIDRFPWMLR